MVGWMILDDFGGKMQQELFELKAKGKLLGHSELDHPAPFPTEVTTIEARLGAHEP